MNALIFKRTMALVVNAHGDVTYRCMACVRREVRGDHLTHLLSWQEIREGTGMFAHTWRLVQVRHPCANCEA
ncbi:MAG: hypothetical protein H0X24_19305 [Ktedonobacterales bacterium]|nr:hypothetical protein [Ktedonobacterales bacterium]